jgi:hypothetical protein
MPVLHTRNQELLCLANTVAHAVILKHERIHRGLLCLKERTDKGIHMQPEGCFHELRRVESISKFPCPGISAFWGGRYLQSRYLFVASCHLARALRDLPVHMRYPWIL